MFNLSNNPGRTAIVNGKDHLFFSGYSYLGMNHVPGFVELVKEGIDKYGFLFPSSRISNTQLDLFHEFETKLSSITGMEATVCFSSGFLAGRAVADMYQGEDYTCAPQTHPAICLEKQSAAGFDEWAQETINATTLFFDSVNPLNAEINDTSFLQQLTQAATCVIDDSHGAGLINGGKGISNNLPGKQNLSFILTYSLSKAYNLVGGAVSCSKQIAERLTKSPFYTASTSMSPAFAFAFLNGQHLYEQQRKKLQQNIEVFKQLSQGRFKSGNELPIFVLPPAIDENRLAENGIIISSFAYPDPSGQKIKRVVLNALHTEGDLQKLADALK
jgi:7-keto-8-aminopelargonate synthetase-like enzyme